MVAPHQLRLSSSLLLPLCAVGSAGCASQRRPAGAHPRHGTRAAGVIDRRCAHVNDEIAGRMPAHVDAACTPFLLARPRIRHLGITRHCIASAREHDADHENYDKSQTAAKHSVTAVT